MVERHAWHLWPHRRWPASASEERALVAAWRDTAGERPSDLSRSAVTLLMVALRAGANADDVATIAPAVRPAALLGAYGHLNSERRRSVVALGRLLDNPDGVRPATVAAAARLFPELVHRLTVGDHPHQILAAEIRAEIDRTAATVAKFERALARLGRDDPTGTTLGQRLFDPYRCALWLLPSFLPIRVGQLSPARVAALLGEEIE